MRRGKNGQQDALRTGCVRRCKSDLMARKRSSGVHNATQTHTPSGDRLVCLCSQHVAVKVHGAGGGDLLELCFMQKRQGVFYGAAD